MSVYFYYLPISGLVKIGVSEDVEQRIKTLSTGCPEVGEVIRVIDDFGFKVINNTKDVKYWFNRTWVYSCRRFRLF